MIVTFDTHGASFPHDICVVGSGPIGLAFALAAAKRGLKVLVLEAGVRKPSSPVGEPWLADGCPPSHTPLSEASCRALGGTSWWWGGRCLPFDDVDFLPRSAAPGGWPMAHGELARFYPESAAFFGCGGAGEFLRCEPRLRALRGIRADQIERWCPPNVALAHLQTLEASKDILIVLNATVSEMHLAEDGRAVASLTVASPHRRQTIAVRRVVVAAGGVGTPRLLLAMQRRHRHLFGGEDGPLGRYYMGHIFGKIAQIALTDPADAKTFDFFLDGGAYARRRFTFTAHTLAEEGLPNISFTPGNAPISDPSHKSGALSLIWLALKSPLGKRLLPEALRAMAVGTQSRYGPHLANVAGTLLPTLMAVSEIARDKYLRKPGKPTIFLRNKAGRYSLYYHAEQSSQPDNRITLSPKTDAFGLNLVTIAFSFSRADAEKVVRAHEVLDHFLRENGIGHLELPQGRQQAVESVLAQARDGMHQMGATRMGRTPSEGVVDEYCRAHGLDNLYVASTSVLPTSGSANPTFVGAALAIRLAHHLADLKASLADRPLATARAV